MNQMQIFNSPIFGQVRTIEEDSKVFFCANDVARALGYAKPRNAIAQHCRGALKRGGVSYTTNQHGKETAQVTEMNFIPEGDVYRLIIRSKLPSAEKFERWLFDEVLVSIRQTGGYNPKIEGTLSELASAITTLVNTVSQMEVRLQNGEDEKQRQRRIPLGKVARLDESLRRDVDEMLMNGCPYREIVEYLGGFDIKLSAMAVHNYNKWLG